MRDDIQTNNFPDDLKQAILDQLVTIVDPEIGLDIFNLGLIYAMEVDSNKHCEITLTFTGMACSCVDTVPIELTEKLTSIEGIDTVKVNIVWEPAWNIQNISRLGRIALGINPN